MVRVSVRGRQACHSKISVWVSLQSEFSNDQVEKSAAFKTAAKPTRYRIKGYCDGALRYVN